MSRRTTDLSVQSVVLKEKQAQVTPFSKGLNRDQMEARNDASGFCAESSVVPGHVREDPSPFCRFPASCNSLFQFRGAHLNPKPNSRGVPVISCGGACRAVCRPLMAMARSLGIVVCIQPVAAEVRGHLVRLCSMERCCRVNQSMLW